MRPYYAEYVKHALRYYIKTTRNIPSEQPRFKTEAEKKNWLTAQAALKTFSADEQEMFAAIYSENIMLSDSIRQYSERHGVHVNHIWNLVNDLEKKVAKRRGLI